jgi:hypothetical protein
MILVTTFYIPKNEVREKEINKCLQNNCKNPHIQKIYLLNDKVYNLPLDSEFTTKVEQVVINPDPNYKLRFDDAIHFINSNLQGSNCILSNSDIYFDKTLGKMDNMTISNNVYALLRYDETENQNGDGPLFELYSKEGQPRADSQDCWIFKSPLKVDTKLLNFEFGTLGCDNVLANIIYNSGIYISNPCLEIRSIHVHSSNFRTYDDSTRLWGTYCKLPPCKLREMPPVFFTDQWNNKIDNPNKAFNS